LIGGGMNALLARMVPLIVAFIRKYHSVYALIWN
jgi:hypothetical protein